MSARFTKLEPVNLAEDESEGEREDSHVSLVMATTGGGGQSSSRIKRKLMNGLKRRRRKSCGCVSSWRWVLVAVIAFSLSIVVSLMVAKLTREPSQGEEEVPPTLLGGAVATDAPVCSQMAADILKRNGSAVDATITALLCVGAVHPESSGIGGGGFMVVYDTNGSVVAIDFRETAPDASTPDMFHSNSSLSTNGGLAVGVPGELRGMELAHNRYGRLNWSDLFEPVIELCRNGFEMTEHTAMAIQKLEAAVRSDPILRGLFTTANGSLKQEGDIVKRERLAATLELVAREGADAFYTGTIAENIVNKVSETGGVLTLHDLLSYRAILKKPIRTEYGGHTLYTPPPPSGGAQLLFPLNLLSLYSPLTPSPSSSSPVSHGNHEVTYHHMVEAFKYMFALRTELGDMECEGCDDNAVWGVVENMTSLDYAAIIKSLISDDITYNISHYHAHYAPPPSDHGTTHISVLSPDGMAVSVTSTVNTYFGSKVVTDNGIVLNDEMDDFSSPNITNAYDVRPSEANFISPGKRPLSSMCPLVAVKTSVGEGVNEFLITGASGGTRIPTATAQVVWRVLSLKQSLNSAIEEKRLHHQLSPNYISVEDGFPDDIIAYLESKGHLINHSTNYAVVQGVHVNEGGVVLAHSDSRKQGHSVVI